jgi:pimeloyl-ACP methyl ester carboxylesterase
MRQIVYLFIFIIVFNGCASKQVPITWKNRIDIRLQQPIELSYTSLGHGATILFLHGFGESKHTWRYLERDLARNYRLYSLDLKGFGDSPKIKDGLYSIYDQALLVENFIKKHRLKNVTIVGHSLGGGVAMVLALMAKKHSLSIRRLVLINTMAYNQQLPSMLRLLNTPVIGPLGLQVMSGHWHALEAYKYAFSDDTKIPNEGVEQSAKMIENPDAKYAYIKTVAQLVPDDIEEMTTRYKKITIPTLIIWGEDDISIGVYNAYRLHYILPNSRLKVFSKIGHMPHEEAPQKVIQEIRKFMKSS